MALYRPTVEVKEKIEAMGLERIWSANKVVTFIVNQYFAGLEGVGTTGEQLQKKEIAVVEQKKLPTKRFTPPTAREVWQYMWEKGCKTQSTADDCHNYYESNGWKVGKNPMKNWKAAAARWMKSEFNKPKGQTKGSEGMQERLTDTSWAK